MTRVLSLMMLALFVLASPSFAEPKLSARELLVAAEAKHRSAAQEYRGELEVRTKAGKIRKKRWTSYRQGYAGDARHLIRFTHPPEVRGVGYLSRGRSGKSPEQWLYLPSMRRERRVGARDRKPSFVGTDFNYEDMEQFDHAKYDAERAGDDTIDGGKVQLIEIRPRDKSVYERQVLAIREDNLFTVRIDSYKPGRKDVWKRLVLRDLEEVDGHWVARTMVMSDLEKERTTTVVLERLAFDRPQPEERFTLQNLNREDDD